MYYGIAAAMLAVLILFMPLRFTAEIKLCLVEVKAKAELKLWFLPVYCATISYKEGVFLEQKKGKKETLEFSYKTNIFLDAVQRSIRPQKIDYIVIISLENLHSTMQTTAFIEYFSKLINNYVSFKFNFPMQSAVLMSVSHRPALDAEAVGILNIRIADIIKNLVVFFFKGAYHARRQSEPN